MIRRVRFNDLPESVREKLSRMLAAEGDPSLVRWFPGHRDWPIVAGVFSGLVLAVAAYVFVWLANEDSRKDPYFDREIYMLLAGLLFVGIGVGLGLVYRTIWKPPPWKWGARFVSGGYVACIDRHDVYVLPLANMGTPTITDVLRNGVYQHSRLNFTVGGQMITNDKVSFIFGSQDDAARLLRDLSAARPVFEAALARKDERALAELDPFAECTLSGKWDGGGSGGPTVATPPGAARLARWLGPLVLAGLITGIYFLALQSACAKTPGCHSLTKRE